MVEKLWSYYSVKSNGGGAAEAVWANHFSALSSKELWFMLCYKEINKKSLIICSCVLWTLSFLIINVWSNGGKDNIRESLESQGGNMCLLWSAGSFPFLCTKLDGHMVRYELRKYEKNKETKQDHENGTFTLF